MPGPTPILSRRAACRALVVGAAALAALLPERAGRVRTPTPPRAAAGGAGGPDVGAPLPRVPGDLDQLMTLPAPARRRTDLALANLLCAERLPGAPGDVPAALRRLDGFAKLVRGVTERRLDRLGDPRYAAHYRHDERVLRVSTMLQALQEDCGVRYDPRLVDAPSFRDARAQFLHGMLEPGRGGTCASMPVLYAAVGRRLGYPIGLVLTRAHIYCRWCDARPFNIEGAGSGFSIFSDAHYRGWPSSVGEAEVAAFGYLRPLGADEELALFLAARGHCLLENGRTAEAVGAYAASARLAPGQRQYGAFRDEAGVALRARRPGCAPARAGAPTTPDSDPVTGGRAWSTTSGGWSASG